MSASARLLLMAMLAATWLGPACAGVPTDYAPLVLEPSRSPGRVEFDLGPALERARREHKRLYVYLGASDCPYCRRYERFLQAHASELVPRFGPWLVVDLRSTLDTTAARLFLRVGASVANYTAFQRAIGDERARMLVYPSVWLFDANLAPLMQMPAGTGTFETVPEQVEILDLVH